MHDESLNQQDQQLPSRFERNPLTELDQRIVRALEATPDAQVPADFAARVASRLPSPRPLSTVRTRYGDHAMRIGIVVLFAALFALAPDATNRSVVGLTMEWLLFAQFIGLTLWLSIRRLGAR
jgi:hypothetical protein